MQFVMNRFRKNIQQGMKKRFQAREEIKLGGNYNNLAFHVGAYLRCPGTEAIEEWR